MSNDSNRWYFTKEQIENSPSRKCGVTPEKEIFYRQSSALLIRDIGHRLKVGLMVCDTAIVYMHRFYMRHSFTKFPRNMICMSAIFLSSKVEESPRKLEHVIKVGYLLIHNTTLDTKSETFQTWVADLVFHENLLLRTLGFDLIVEHPQKMILTSLNQFHVTQDVIQATYYFASSMFITSTFCLRFTPRIMACICIYIFKNWAKFSIPNEWWLGIDKNITRETIKELNQEYLNIISTCPENVKNICFKNVGKLFDFPPLFLNSGNSSQSRSSEPHHHSARSDSRHSLSHNRDSVTQSHHRSSSTSTASTSAVAVASSSSSSAASSSASLAGGVNQGASTNALPPQAPVAVLLEPSLAASRHISHQQSVQPFPSNAGISRSHNDNKKPKLDYRNAPINSGIQQQQTSTSATSSSIQQSTQQHQVRALSSGSQVSSSTGGIDNINPKSSRNSSALTSNLGNRSVPAPPTGHPPPPPPSSSSLVPGQQASSSSLSLSSLTGSNNDMNILNDSGGIAKMEPIDILKMRKNNPDLSLSSSSSSVILQQQQQQQRGISSSNNNNNINHRLILDQMTKVENEDNFKMEFSDNEDSNPMTDNSFNQIEFMMNEQLISGSDRTLPNPLPVISPAGTVLPHPSLSQTIPAQPSNLSAQTLPPPPPPSLSSQPSSSHHHHHHHSKNDKATPFNLAGRLNYAQNASTSNSAIPFGSDNHSPADIIRLQKLSAGNSTVSSLGSSSFNAGGDIFANPNFKGPFLGLHQPTTSNNNSSQNLDDVIGSGERHKHKKNKKEKKKHKKEKKHKHKKKDKEKDHEKSQYSAIALGGENGLKLRLKKQPDNPSSNDYTERSNQSDRLINDISTSTSSSQRPLTLKLSISQLSNPSGKKRKYPEDDYKH